MLKISTIVIICITVFVLLLSVSCRAKEKHIPGKPYYYGTFGGYGALPHLSDNITREAALNKDGYYIAYYDEQDRLIAFAKYYKGKVIFSNKYYYRSTGTLERREGVGETGGTTIYYFDKKGKIIDK